ncbi:UNVERIFIED_CONTAM: hypothetical protein NCL1_22456 [Trichonephila clavipes]
MLISRALIIYDNVRSYNATLTLLWAVANRSSLITKVFLQADDGYFVYPHRMRRLHLSSSLSQKRANID